MVLVSMSVIAQHDHAKMDKKSTDQSSIKIEYSKVTSDIIENYLNLKNALVQDNSITAASSGKLLFDAIAKFDVSSQAEMHRKELNEIFEDASEHAEHITESKGSLDHQREHFVILSEDIKDFILIVGADRKLYNTFCPMYDGGKGGNWLSEAKEIKNPFYGSKMLKCGSVQQEFSIK